jgi:hypothetical protein
LRHTLTLSAIFKYPSSYTTFALLLFMLYIPVVSYLSSRVIPNNTPSACAHSLLCYIVVYLYVNVPNYNICRIKHRYVSLLIISIS